MPTLAQQHVYDILADLATKAESYLGIGVQEGHCLEHVLDANPSIKLLALCDTWGFEHGGTGRGSHAHITKMLELRNFKGVVTYLDGDSTKLIPTLTGTVYDLVFVDGSHNEQPAFRDMVNAWPLTRQAMAVHDIHMPEVRAALIKFFDQSTGVRVVEYSHESTGTVVVYR